MGPRLPSDQILRRFLPSATGRAFFGRAANPQFSYATPVFSASKYGLDRITAQRQFIHHPHQRPA